MSNIVEFPGREPPPEGYSEEYVDKLHAEAFRDLEGRIDDCAIMASIAIADGRARARPGRQARKGDVCGVPGRGHVEEAQGGLSGHVARREAVDMKRRRRYRKRNRQRLVGHARRLRR
jgi:hypothetical protein